MKKRVNKSEKSLHPGMNRMYEILRKNYLNATQLSLLFDVTEPGAVPNPYITEMKPAIDELIVSGWLQEDGTTLTEKGAALFTQIEGLFKAVKNSAPDVPQEMVVRFNGLFPAIKGGSGKYLRCNEREVTSAFQWFRKNYPEYSWEAIMEAGRSYVDDQMQENYKYCRRVKYFIRKMQQDKSFESELAEYCARLSNGAQEESNTYNEKVV